MTSIIQKFSLLGCLGLSIAACSSVNLDNNADKIQTQPTSSDQKQLITVHQVDANGVGAPLAPCLSSKHRKACSSRLHWENFPQVNMVFISMKTAHVKQH